MDAVVPNLAFGYSRERTPSGKEWRNNLYQHVIKGGPAGGGFSTVEDLLRFGEALRSHRLLTPASTELLWSPKPGLGSSEYGYGFGVVSGPLGRKVGHSGGFPGISSNLDLFLDSGWTAVVMSNYGGGSSPVVDRIEELLARIER
jgi:CubicO group peptidase (beta-lactamase class C family)